LLAEVSTLNHPLQEDREFGIRMTVREVLKMLEADGWRLVVTRGSHRQFKHATKSGRVTVSGKSSDELPPGTLNSILKQSGLKR
jgi:predicted RNA binding protein YcfA (HicA-like mRNA interferase family)